MSTPALTTSAAATENRLRKLVATGLFQMLVPYTTVVVCWPLSSGLFKTPYAFEKAFLGAELLLVGAMICIAVVLEIYCEVRHLRNTQGIALDVILFVSFLCAVLFLFVFGFFKVKSFTFDFPPTEGENLRDEIKFAVYWSILGGIFALSWCIYAFCHAYKLLWQTEVQSLGTPPQAVMTTP